MAEEIVMTPENKPLLDALIRLVALGRDPDAEDMLVEAIQELVAKRAEIAAMREIVEAVAKGKLMFPFPGISFDGVGVDVEQLLPQARALIDKE